MARRIAPSIPTGSETDQPLHSNRQLIGTLAVCLGVGLASFCATEIMYYLLVPDIGRRWERWLAEGVSALIVALLTLKLIHAANQRREAALLRMQVISEMNHHIRNALAAISLSTDSIQNQACIRVISDSVDRIEWALREILVRPKPIPEEENDLRYFGIGPRMHGKPEREKTMHS
jgi:signal transduction histidine kinase